MQSEHKHLLVPAQDGGVYSPAALPGVHLRFLRWHVALQMGMPQMQQWRSPLQLAHGCDDPACTTPQSSWECRLEVHVIVIYCRVAPDSSKIADAYTQDDLKAVLPTTLAV